MRTNADGGQQTMASGLRQCKAAGSPVQGEIELGYSIWLTDFTGLLTVYIRVKPQADLQADKSPVIVKGPFFPRVVNPRYRIRGTNV
jgi:hypothetical protein